MENISGLNALLFHTKTLQANICTAKIHLWDENTLLVVLLVLKCLLITLNEYSENMYM